MPYFPGNILRELRAKLNTSQRGLSLVLSISTKTIVRYERDGTTSREYVHRLLRAIENPDATPMPQVLKRGPQQKPYRIARQRRYKDNDRWHRAADERATARYVLWAPERKHEHLRAIEARPFACGRTIVWYERTNTKVNLWERMSISKTGEIKGWGIESLNGWGPGFLDTISP